MLFNKSSKFSSQVDPSFQMNVFFNFLEITQITQYKNNTIELDSTTLESGFVNYRKPCGQI